jgi:hypothetical protein
MKFLDPDDPFFRNPLVRWLTVLLPTAWGLVELFWIGQPFWGGLFLAAGGYAAYMLLIRRKG